MNYFELLEDTNPPCSYDCSLVGTTIGNLISFAVDQRGAPKSGMSTVSVSPPDRWTFPESKDVKGVNIPRLFWSSNYSDTFRYNCLVLQPSQQAVLPNQLNCDVLVQQRVARRGLQIVLNIQDVLWLARTVSYMCTQASSNLPFVPYLFHLVPCCPARNFSTCQHLKASMPPTKTSLWVQTPGTSWYHMYPKIAG